MTDDGDFTSYVAARWTHLVRTLVAVGAPLGPAHHSAAETLTRCHDSWEDRDQWLDLDVHVFRDLLDGWDRRRDAWWERPVREPDLAALVEAGWPEVEGVLDRMTVPDRRALVLREVAGLSEDQAQEVIGTEAPVPAAAPPELVRTLELVPVRSPRLDAIIAASRRRRRRRRGVSIAGGAALVVMVSVVTALVVGRSEPPGAGTDESFSPVRSVPYDSPLPVAWYAAGTFYLPHAQIPVRDVREFGQWDDGAVYLDLRGNLVSVTGEGERALIATLGEDSSFVVHPVADLVVWVDPEAAELVVHDVDEGERRLERPLEEERPRVISVAADRALLTSAEGLFEVDLADGSVTPVADERLPGEIDRHGRFVLTREGGGATTARVRLYETDARRPVPLAVDEPGSVVAARFGPDGSVILLIEPPGARNSEIRRCAPPYDRCRLVAFFPAGGARSLLAE